MHRKTFKSPFKKGGGKRTDVEASFDVVGEVKTRLLRGKAPRNDRNCVIDGFCLSFLSLGGRGLGRGGVLRVGQSGKVSEKS